MSIKSRHIKKVIGRKGKVLIIKLPPLPELPRDIYQYIASKIEFLETFLAFRLSCKRANEACQPFKHKLFDQLFDQQTCQPKKYQQNLQREKEFQCTLLKTLIKSHRDANRRQAKPRQISSSSKNYLPLAYNQPKINNNNKSFNSGR